MPMLPDAPWRHWPGLDGLLDALGAAEGAARFVGGAVRDTLLEQPVGDVDIATVHEPAEVIRRLGAAGIRTVPTGIDHGTVTGILEGHVVEITTLRRDVSTDGRRATISFTADWREDATRRDFTINALYADPLTGEVHDFFGGMADLEARHVRFIGNAADRIAEDHLRILRYFRFLARFGNGREPDEEAYSACMAHATRLMALSRERIADEMLKLLALPDPGPVVTLMVDGDILHSVLPEITATGVGRLRALVAREEAAAVPANALRRLAALLPHDPATGEAVAARLKLSKRARKRIALALGARGEDGPEAMAYRIGAEGAIDRILLDESADPAEAARLNGWQAPELPVGGAMLIERGMTPGPQIARALHAIEEQWIAEAFPDRQRVEAIADQIVSKFQRARQ